MRKPLCLLVAIGLLPAALLMPQPAAAVPPIWEPNFGGALAALTGTDDAQTSVVLSFAFPYDAATFTTVWVGTNGCVQLGTAGADGDIDYDYWVAFGDFIDDGTPLICAFETDLDLGITGTIHFNDFGDRAVFTWNEVGTDEDKEALASFQIQLESSGRIVFGYNGVLDGPGEDPLTSLNEGIVIGITSSNGVDPGPTDLSGSPFLAGGTTYERWCYLVADSCQDNGGAGRPKPAGGRKARPEAANGVTLPGPINTAFDLDQSNVVFGAVPSVIEVPTLDRVGLAALAALVAAAAFLVLRRRG